MNITFFIGNGFDLAQGLPTRYTDFYRFLEAHGDELAKNPHLKELFDNRILHNYKHWSDLELALGQYTEEYRIEYSKSFRELKSELDRTLIWYFRLVEQEYQLPVNEEKACKFIGKIRDFYQEFEEPEQDHFRKMIMESNQWDFRFITLNYTGYLDQFLESAKALEGKKAERYRWNFDASMRNFTIPHKALHVHGTIRKDNDVILGVNGPEQIAGTNLFVKDVAPYMVKTEINKVRRLGRTEETEALIDRSQYICLFGVSMGETDIYWWDKITKWLLNDEKRRLVIYKCQPNEGPFSGPGFTAYQQNVDDCRDQFLKVGNTNHIIKSASVESALRERIIVVLGSGIFKFDNNQKATCRKSDTRRLLSILKFGKSQKVPG